jgi:hypothetical protein
LNRESIFSVIFLAIGITISNQYFGEIGIIGNMIVGGISAGLGYTFYLLLKQIKQMFNPNKQNVETITETNEIAVSNENVEVVTNNETVADKQIPIGFGGWLYIVAFNALFIFGTSIFYIFDTLFPIFYSEQWTLLTKPGSEFYHPMWSVALIGELIINSSFAALLLYAMYLCYKGKRLFPKIMISFYIIMIVFSLIDFLLIQSIPDVAQPMNYETLKPIIHPLFHAAIWIPYFMVSKRVKNTYIY